MPLSKEKKAAYFGKMQKYPELLLEALHHGCDERWLEQMNDTRLQMRGSQKFSWERTP